MSRCFKEGSAERPGRGWYASPPAPAWCARRRAGLPAHRAVSRGGIDSPPRPRFSRIARPSRLLRAGLDSGAPLRILPGNRAGRPRKPGSNPSRMRSGGAGCTRRPVLGIMMPGRGSGGARRWRGPCRTNCERRAWSGPRRPAERAPGGMLRGLARGGRGEPGHLPGRGRHRPPGALPRPGATPFPVRGRRRLRPPPRSPPARRCRCARNEPAAR